MTFKINLKLLPMKGHYLFYNAALAPVLPFIPVVARDLGFSGMVIGIVYTIIPICALIAKPTVGAIADRFGITKILFIFFQVLTATMLLPIFFIPSLPSEADVHVSCLNKLLKVDTSPKNFTDIPKDFLSKLTERKKLTCELLCPLDINVAMNLTKFNLDSLVKFTIMTETKDVGVKNESVYFQASYYYDHKDLKPTKCMNDQLSVICKMKCSSKIMNDYLATRKDGGIMYMLRSYQFWIFLAIMIIAWSSSCVVGSMSDAICFEILDDPAKYGQQRLWGSFGWGSLSILGGILVDAFSSDLFSKNYISVLVILIIMSLLSVISSSRIKFVQPEHSPSITKDVTKLLKNVRIVLFMIWCMCVGICTALFWNYLFWLVEDLAKNSPDTYKYLKTIEGLILGTRCFLGEIPFFYASGWILKRLGHVTCMSLVLGIDGMRIFLYTLVPNPWFIIPIEALNGISFGLFYATMVSYASVISPTGTETTVQGLVGAVFEGVGVSIGSLLGGVLIDSFGTITMFLIFGSFALLGCVLHFIAHFIINKFLHLPDRNQMKTSEDQEVTR